MSGRSLPYRNAMARPGCAAMHATALATGAASRAINESYDTGACPFPRPDATEISHAEKDGPDDQVVVDRPHARRHLRGDADRLARSLRVDDAPQIHRTVVDDHIEGREPRP